MPGAYASREAFRACRCDACDDTGCMVPAVVGAEVDVLTSGRSERVLR